MRIGALPALRLGSLQKIQEFKIYKVTVYEDSNDESICFTTPECATAIDFYLQQRERRGERVRYHGGKGIRTPEDTTPFRKEYNKDDPFQVPHARPLSKPGIDYQLQQIPEKAGIIMLNLIFQEILWMKKEITIIMEEWQSLQVPVKVLEKQ
jgi:hypothetical protein